MPQTKFQEVVFGLMMVILMVFAMVTYNMSLHNGALTGSILLNVLKAMPLICLIAFLIDFFLVGPIVKKITFKVLDAKKVPSIFITLMISCLTVAFMCPIMTFVANAFFEFESFSRLIPNWLQTWTLSFPMAFFWQVFYAGPLVRFLFGKMFAKKIS